MGTSFSVVVSEKTLAAPRGRLFLPYRNGLLEHKGTHVADISCFDCKKELKSEPKQLRSGEWVAQCDICGVTNKLTQHADAPDKFTVTGMILNYRREKKKNLNFLRVEYVGPKSDHTSVISQHPNLTVELRQLQRLQPFERWCGK